MVNRNGRKTSTIPPCAALPKEHDVASLNNTPEIYCISTFYFIFTSSEHQNNPDAKNLKFAWPLKQYNHICVKSWKGYTIFF